MTGKLIFGTIWLAMIAQGLWRRRPREALWTWWPVAVLLVPIWMVWVVRTVRLDARGVAALAFLTLLLFRSVNLTRPKLLLTDMLVGVLIVSMCVTQYLSGDLKVTVPFEMLRFWLLPYLVGRLFFSSSEDVEKALPLILRVLALVCVMAIFESVAKVNVVNKIFGANFYHLETAEGYRWGLKRAQGPTEHPIGLGLLLLSFLPWALEGFRRGGKDGHPLWWKVVPILVLGAVIGTVSRSAMIGFVLVVGLFVFFRWSYFRIPLAVGATIIGGTLYTHQQEVMDLLVSAEKHRQIRMTVKVNGKDVEYSGVRHRQLLAEVYGDALDEAGVFGYGPYVDSNRVPIHPETDTRFESIDDHYILYTLQYGHGGKVLFLGLLSVGVIYLAIAAWNTHSPGSGLAAGLCGSLIVVSLMLKSVFFSPDFAAMWLFNIGLAACLHRIGRQEHRPFRDPELSEPTGPLRNLARRPETPPTYQKNAASLPLRSLPPRNM